MVKIVGHRGVRFIEPENTLRAVRRAIELGVDAVEIDIRATSDMNIVVIHDETLDRTTNGRGYVNKYTLSELRSLDAGKGEKIPTLNEVINEIDGKVELFIEIKDPIIVRKVVEIVSRYDYSWMHVISFYHPIVKIVKNLLPKISTGIIISSEPVDPICLTRSANADIIIPNIRYASDRLIKMCHENNILVSGWVINDPKIFKQYSDKLDYITTDRPDIIIPLVR